MKFSLNASDNNVEEGEEGKKDHHGKLSHCMACDIIRRKKWLILEIPPTIREGSIEGQRRNANYGSLSTSSSKAQPEHDGKR